MAWGAYHGAARLASPAPPRDHHPVERQQARMIPKSGDRFSEKIMRQQIRDRGHVSVG
jgi:hypothetical protein